MNRDSGLQMDMPLASDLNIKRDVLACKPPPESMNTKRQAKNFRSSCLWTPPTTRAALIFALALISTVLVAREAVGQKKQRAASAAARQAARPGIPEAVMLGILRMEDERHWDEGVGKQMFDKDARVRRRVALAAGRIGDERAIASLLVLLQSDTSESVRAMAAFAMGEIESAAGIEPLLAALQGAGQSSEVRARVIEAIGKIGAGLPPTDEAHARS